MWHRRVSARHRTLLVYEGNKSHVIKKTLLPQWNFPLHIKLVFAGFHHVEDPLCLKGHSPCSLINMVQTLLWWLQMNLHVNVLRPRARGRGKLSVHRIWGQTEGCWGQKHGTPVWRVRGEVNFEFTSTWFSDLLLSPAINDDPPSYLSTFGEQDIYMYT